MQSGGLAGLEILIIEDEPLVRRQLTAQLEKLGSEVTAAADLAAARRFVAEQEFDFALLDVNLPDGSGTDLLKEGTFPRHTAVVVMTAEAGIAGAVEAMRLGAVDYLAKPFDPGELPLVLGRARRYRESERAEEHRREEADPSGGGFFFGASLAPLERQLEKIIAADRRLQQGLPPVLIQGETGTGKTTIARWLHHRGPRARHPLVEVNCSALPETLAESELFGHERGAFTDARTARMGLFEAANGGTLFLDELPTLSPPVQAKVLTAIEDRKIRRVGGQKSIEVDARVVAATSQELARLVAEGKFREDLYHRLDLYRIVIPPLRERRGDLLKLAGMIIATLCRRHRLQPREISDIGKQRLLAYRWPGNVRELAHELERSLVFEEGGALDFAQLGAAAAAGAGTLDPKEWFNTGYQFPEQGFSLEAAITRLIQHALKQTDNNVSAAARLLGVSRDYVRYRLSGQRPTDPSGE